MDAAHISASLSLNEAVQKSPLRLAIVSDKWFLLQLRYPSAPGVRFYEGLTPIGGRTVYQVAANFMEDHCKYLPRSPAGPEALA